MKKYHFYVLFFLSIFVISACGEKTVDTEAPTLTINSSQPMSQSAMVCGETEQGVFILQGGEALSLDLSFTDNIALSQYKVDIHNNFDCHGHGSVAAPSISPPSGSNTTSDWTLLDIVDIGGTTANISRILEVPENVTAGNYHFELQVVDESGNDIPSAYVSSLIVTNPTDQVAPTLTVNEPLSSSFSVAKGEKVRFTGSLTDNYSLSEGGNGVLFLSYKNLSNGNVFLSDAIFPFDNSTSTSYDFDFEFTVPTTLIAGDFEFTLGATDGVRNVAESAIFKVDITN